MKGRLKWGGGAKGGRELCVGRNRSKGGGDPAEQWDVYVCYIHMHINICTLHRKGSWGGQLERGREGTRPVKEEQEGSTMKYTL